MWIGGRSGREFGDGESVAREKRDRAISISDGGEVGGREALDKALGAAEADTVGGLAGRGITSDGGGTPRTDYAQRSIGHGATLALATGR